MSLPHPDSLCHRCRALRTVGSERGGRYLMCTALDEKYPRQPVRACPAFDDAQLQWGAPPRNRAAILAVLQRVLPRAGVVLEVASGSGQHAAWFARSLPALTWLPSDIDPDGRASVRAWTAVERLANVRPPIALDVTDPAAWPDAADAVFCANMVHIAPWACCLGLLDGAARLLSPGQPLVTYGPYRFAGRFTADSNARFDASLKARDPSWGVRDVEDIEREANARGLVLEETVEMPANNHTLVWRRT